MEQIEVLKMKLEARDLEIVALKDWVKNHEDSAVSQFDRIKEYEARLNDSTNFNNKLHIKNREQRHKILELVKCLKEAAVTCKEKNLLKDIDASYWLGAENAYLQVVTSATREFELKDMCYKDTTKECTENCKGQCRQSM